MNTRTRVRVRGCVCSAVYSRWESAFLSADLSDDVRGRRKERTAWGLTLVRLSFTLSFLKKGSPVRIDRSTSYSLPHRDAYLVTGPADCIVITVLNILHRARELTKSAMGVGSRRWNKVEVKGDS